MSKEQHRSRSRENVSDAQISKLYFVQLRLSEKVVDQIISEIGKDAYESRISELELSDIIKGRDKKQLFESLYIMSSNELTDILTDTGATVRSQE